METRELKLSKRLQAVAAMVTKGNVVCDVGCDHGFVPVFLVKNGISPKVIAMDRNEGPLQAAKGHIGEYFLADYIEARLSDGLEALEAGEAETVICAGMGGRLVIRILEDGKGKLAGSRELILQPQSELRSVREYLRKQGYFIADENMIAEDGKYYPMMRACREAGLPEEGPPGGNEGIGTPKAVSGTAFPKGCKPEKWQRIEDKYGPVLLRKKHPVLKEYLQREIAICGKIAENLRENREQAKRRQEIAQRQEDAGTALSFFGD